MDHTGILSLSQRSREVFRHIVDSFVETGEPIGSRTLSRRMGQGLSPATVRNVMADLEEAGLLFAPHVSAGRLPTDLGLRIFVDALLEIGGDLTREERESIDGKCAATGRSFSEVMEETGAALAGLTECAGLVISPKTDAPLRQIEFLALNGGKALVVMVTDGGMVENRVIDLPAGLPPSALAQAANYINSHLANATMQEARFRIQTEIAEHRTELDALTGKLVSEGIALWAGGAPGGSLILRGQSKLLNDVHALEDLERIRQLFETLERRENLLQLLEATGDADGVQIFIGSENMLFRNSGCSMIIAPYHDQNRRVVGALGVIGPTRMNYARIIPMVDYTSKLLGRLLD